MRRVIYTFWTGTNEMSANRKRSLEQLKAVSDCEVVLITPANLKDFILEDAPLHPAYRYLSFTHRSDYLRTYFMNFYGGGYSDVKETTSSWKSSFEMMDANEDKWICGYGEQGAFDIAYFPVREHWRDLIGNGAYICKPHTPLTEEWYADMIALLDSKLERLQVAPARSPQDCREISPTGYPIEWNEMLGRIFHRVCFKYKEHLDNTLPRCICVNYR